MVVKQGIVALEPAWGRAAWAGAVYAVVGLVVVAGLGGLVALWARALQQQDTTGGSPSGVVVVVVLLLLVTAGRRPPVGGDGEHSKLQVDPVRRAAATSERRGNAVP